jgi:hypothetical protein
MEPEGKMARKISPMLRPGTSSPEMVEVIWRRVR